MRYQHLSQIWRLFILQSSRNSRTLDGLGFFHVLSPLIKRWVREKVTLEELVARYMGYFSTHPLLASFAAGAVVDLEERRRSGDRLEGEYIARIRDSLSGVLAAKGGYFFDTVLVPLGLTIGSIFVIHSSYIGLAIFLALYNYYHFRFRIGGYSKGMRLGGRLGHELIARLFREQEFLGGCAAFASGVFAALVFTRAYELGGTGITGWGVACAAAVWLLSRKLSFMLSVAVVLCATGFFLVLR